MFLSINSLTIKHKDQIILDDISFIIEEGKIISIIGNSGSGKSTLSNFITNSLPTELTYSGIITFSNIQHKNKIKYISQNPLSSFNPIRKLGKQLKDYGIKSKEVAINLLKSVEVNNPERILNSFPHQISLGELQRVAISSALYSKPKLLICDEITSSLDSKAKYKIVSLLKELIKLNKVSILFITHDLRIAHQIADTIYEIKNKKLYPITKLSINHSNEIKETQNDKTVILSTENLSFSYNSEIFNFGNTKFISGEITGIIGHSGSGKSTFSKIIYGEIPFNQGHIKFEGRLFEESINISSKIQYIHQNSSETLNPSLSIGYILTEAIKNSSKQNIDYEEGIIAIERYLIEFNLNTSILKKYPHQLSGGQKQKINLLRALIYKPKVIIFDEVLSSIDITTKEVLIHYITKIINKYNITGILITHDIYDLISLCKRFYFIKNGEMKGDLLVKDYSIEKIKKLY